MPQRADQTNYFYIAPHAFTDNINDGYGLAFWNKDFVSLSVPQMLGILFRSLWFR